MLRLVRADSAERWATARGLIEGYAASLHLDLSFQNFDGEIANLAREYGPPGGALLLAEREGTAIGCVALRPFEDGVCEMKRLYVVPEGRGSGAGRALAESIIAEGRRLGYARMVLDTRAAHDRSTGVVHFARVRADSGVSAQSRRRRHVPRVEPLNGERPREGQPCDHHG